MRIVSYRYYLDEYFGESTDEKTFTALYKRAVLILNAACLKDLEKIKLHAYPQEFLKNALCAQIEYCILNGGSDFAGGGSLPKSMALGRFSLSEDEDESLLSPIALEYLKLSGILKRSVDICG